MAASYEKLSKLFLEVTSYQLVICDNEEDREKYWAIYNNLVDLHFKDNHGTDPWSVYAIVSIALHKLKEFNKCTIEDLEQLIENLSQAECQLEDHKDSHNDLLRNIKAAILFDENDQSKVKEIIAQDLPKDDKDFYKKVLAEMTTKKKGNTLKKNLSLPSKIISELLRRFKAICNTCPPPHNPIDEEDGEELEEDEFQDALEHTDVSSKNSTVTPPSPGLTLASSSSSSTTSSRKSPTSTTKAIKTPKKKTPEEMLSKQVFCQGLKLSAKEYDSVIRMTHPDVEHFLSKYRKESGATTSTGSFGDLPKAMDTNGNIITVRPLRRAGNSKSRAEQNLKEKEERRQERKTEEAKDDEEEESESKYPPRTTRSQDKVQSQEPRDDSETEDELETGRLQRQQHKKTTPKNKDNNRQKTDEELDDSDSSDTSPIPKRVTRSTPKNNNKRSTPSRSKSEEKLYASKRTKRTTRSRTFSQKRDDDSSDSESVSSSSGSGSSSQSESESESDYDPRPRKRSTRASSPRILMDTSVNVNKLHGHRKKKPKSKTTSPASNSASSSAAGSLNGSSKGRPKKSSSRLAFSSTPKAALGNLAKSMQKLSATTVDPLPQPSYALPATPSAYKAPTKKKRKSQSTTTTTTTTKASSAKTTKRRPTEEEDDSSTSPDTTINGAVSRENILIEKDRKRTIPQKIYSPPPRKMPINYSKFNGRPVALSRGQTYTNQRTRKKWTAQEMNYLRRGVEEFGKGSWSKIWNNYDFADRTQIDLKDKWRNMVKKGENYGIGE